jgi:hypothetical protein
MLVIKKFISQMIWGYMLCRFSYVRIMSVVLSYFKMILPYFIAIPIITRNFSVLSWVELIENIIFDYKYL